MPRFSANLGFLWPELPLIARVHAAKRAGFDAVECHWPYDVPAIHLGNALRATGMEMLSINTRPGDRAKGEFGVMALAGREAEALAHVVEALDYADAIACERVHVMIGFAPRDDDHALQRVIELLDIALEEAARRDITVLIEPMNPISVPGYLISSYLVAEEINERLNGAVGVMLDTFHATMMGHDPVTVFDAYRPWLGHIQFSEAPDRGPPKAGSALFDFFRHVDASDWDGFVGAEYKPNGETDASLEWLERERRGE